jgi:DNA-binding protein YbaB
LRTPSGGTDLASDNTEQEQSVTTARDVVPPLAAARERSRAQVAQYHQIRAALEKLRVSATSTDRSVTVELAAGGAIVDLRLTRQAMEKTPEKLAGTILEAIRIGLADVAERTTAEVAPLTGRRVDVAAIAQGRLPSLAQDTPDQPAAPIEPAPTSQSRGDSDRFLPEEDEDS